MGHLFNYQSVIDAAKLSINMKKQVRRLFAISSCLLLTSCFSIGTVSSDNYEMNQKRFIEAEVFQTLSDHQVLAYDENYTVISIIDNNDEFYDGKKIRGYFTMFDTYSYYTKDDFRKTVPLLVRNGRKGLNKTSDMAKEYDLR